MKVLFNAQIMEIKEWIKRWRRQTGYTVKKR